MRLFQVAPPSADSCHWKLTASVVAIWKLTLRPAAAVSATGWEVMIGTGTTLTVREAVLLVTEPTLLETVTV